LTDLARWSEAHKDFKFVYWVTDEPREMNDTGFNLNFAQTMELVKICKQVKGLKCMVTIENNGEKGTDYPAMVQLLDATLKYHSNKNGWKIIEAARKLNTYYTYNSGVGRYDYGIHAWRIGSLGKYEWHWQFGGIDTFSPAFTQSVYVYRYKDDLFTSPMYERASEGVTDYKYLYTLGKKIKEALAGTDEKKKKAAGEAKAYLDELYSKTPDFIESRFGNEGDAGLPITGNVQLEEWRWKLAQYLEALN
jgi:hypothetical protein